MEKEQRSGVVGMSTDDVWGETIEGIKVTRSNQVHFTDLSTHIQRQRAPPPNCYLVRKLEIHQERVSSSVSAIRIKAGNA